MANYLHLVDPNECPTCGTLHAPDAECPEPPVTTYSIPDDGGCFVWVDAPAPPAKPAPEISVYTMEVATHE